MTEPTQRSLEWYAARKGRVTGSIVGAILGLNPNMTRADVMRQMVREREGAPNERDQLSDFAKGIMEHGRYAEDGALFDFTLETGIGVKPAPFVTFEDWLGASPDGYGSDDGVVEVKSPWSKRKQVKPEWKTCLEQPHYHAQCQIEAFVTKAPWIHFWQYRPGFTDAEGRAWESVGVYERVPYSQEWIDENLPRLAQFYSEFLDEPAAEHLAPKRAVVDTPAAHLMVREWDELSESLELLEARKKDLLQEIVALAGERDTEFAGRKLTRVSRAGSVSYAAVVKKHLPKLDLAPYRGAGSTYWQVK